MPTQKLALIRGGPKRLEISRALFSWRNIVVRLDGQEVGAIRTRKELIAGQHFPLPDGSVLTLRLTRSFLNSELQVFRDGWPVPGSSSDPAKLLSNAYQAIFFIAGVNIVVGLLALLFNVQILAGLGANAITFLFGLVFLALGFAVKSESKTALWIAIGIFALDTVLLVFVTLQFYAEASTTLASGVEFRNPYEKVVFENNLITVGWRTLSALCFRAALFVLMWRGRRGFAVPERIPFPTMGEGSVALHELLGADGYGEKSKTPRKRKSKPWSPLEIGLAGLAVLLVVAIAGFVLMQVTSRAAVSEASLPTLAPMPTIAPTFAPLPTPEQVIIGGPYIPLPFPVVDAEYSTALDRIIAVSSQPDQLHIYDPVTYQTADIDLDTTPIKVSVSPDGRFAAVAYRSAVSYIDLLNMQVNITAVLNTSVFDLVLADDG